MRQTYFGVDVQVYLQLEEELVHFSRMTRELFDSSTGLEQKTKLKKEKDLLRNRIQEKLSGSGSILGFLTEDQVEELNKVIKRLENADIRNLLGSNRIPYDRLEESIGALLAFSDNPPANLIFFLERAKQNRNSVIVWIM